MGWVWVDTLQFSWVGPLGLVNKPYIFFVYFGVLPYCYRVRPPSFVVVRRSFVHHKVRGSNISKIESPNCTWASKLTYCPATPDMRLVSTSGRKLSRMNVQPPTTSGRISWEKFTRGSRNFMHLSGDTGHTKRSATISLSASIRLRNLIKYCTNVRKSVRLAKESSSSTIV